MTGLVHHLRRNAISYLALFVALGGTSYAAMSLPRASVGARQLKNHSIDPIKLDPKFISGSVRAWAVVDSSGRVIGGGGKPRGGATVTPGSYAISWGVKLKPNCATNVSVDFGHSPITEHIPIPGTSSAPFTAGYAVGESFGGGHRRQDNVTSIHTFDQAGRLTPLGFDVAVTC